MYIYCHDEGMDRADKIRIHLLELLLGTFNNSGKDRGLEVCYTTVFFWVIFPVFSSYAKVL